MCGAVTPVLIDKWRPPTADAVWVGGWSNRRSLSHLSPSLDFIFLGSFLLHTAPHYLNAWNRLEKLNLRKSIGNLLDKLRKLYMNGMITLEIFSRPQEIENSRLNIYLPDPNRYFTENSRWVPL